MSTAIAKIGRVAVVINVADETGPVGTYTAPLDDIDIDCATCYKGALFRAYKAALAQAQESHGEIAT